MSKPLGPDASAKLGQCGEGLPVIGGVLECRQRLLVAGLAHRGADDLSAVQLAPGPSAANAVASRSLMLAACGDPLKAP